MRYLTVIVVVFILLTASSLSLFGQQDVKINRRDFRTDKPGFDQAWKSVRAGDRLYSRGGEEFSAAITEYTKARDHNPDNAALNYKLGASYLFSENRGQSLAYLLKALDADPNIAGDILFLTGRAYQYNGMFIEAVSKYTKYMDADIRKSRQDIEKVKLFIDECNAAIVIASDTLRIEIVNAGETINSSADEYSPVPGPEDKRLYFASRRPVSRRSSSRYEDGKADEKIFISTKSDGLWSLAMPLEGRINSGYSESPLFISEDGTTLYIYAGYRGNGDILVSELRNGVWRRPVPFNVALNSHHQETSFAISPRGDEIAFVSTRRGGFGGRDIWFMKRSVENRWSNPENAGPILNSDRDEEGVAWSGGGDTLWFSSQGHNSIGGFDIFYSVRETDGSWGKPINAGIPINSVYDDLHYKPSRVNDSIFYFSSNRYGGMGGFDIWFGRIMPPEPEPEPEPVEEPEPVIQVPDTVRIVDTVVVREIIREVLPEVRETNFYIEGRVLDSVSMKPLMARIDFIDTETYLVAASFITSENDGRFRVNVRNIRSYMAETRSNGYLSDMRKILIPEEYIGESYNTTILLNKMEVGQRVVLQNIFFETGSAVLTAGSFSELEKLHRVMQENSTMKIEISGHTDSTGSEAINLRLSRDRAASVAAYLIGKGIDTGRIETRGYGSSQPIDVNTTAEGRAKNRRVEFKILEF